MNRLRGSLLLVLLFISAINAQELHHRPRYTLRPGDVLQLQYRYTPELNQTVTLLPDGYVNLNMVGDLKISDLSLEQAHDLILSKLQTQLNEPELNLILTDFQRPYVEVAGEVQKPGKIDLRETTTAMQAILESGGFLPSAQSGQVILFRRINSNTAEVRKINLNGIHKTSQLEQDMALESGDMLLVPRNKVERISRYGKLLNVGTYFNPLSLIH
jgi:polysaccharide export outer membrane protein